MLPSRHKEARNLALVELLGPLLGSTEKARRAVSAMPARQRRAVFAKLGKRASGARRAAYSRARGQGKSPETAAASGVAAAVRAERGHAKPGPKAETKRPRKPAAKPEPKAAPKPAGGGASPASKPEAATSPAPARPEPKSFRTAAQADAYHKANTGAKPSHLTKDEDRAVRTYQGHSYEQINGTLRSGRPGDADERRVIRDLDSAMGKSKLREPVTTHRGMVAPPGSKAADFLDGLSVGSTFRDPAYTSTTVDPKGVDRFLGNLGPQPKGTRKVKMNIRVPEGASGIYMNGAAPPRGFTDFTKEYELLLARGGEYRVVGRRDKGGTVELDVEYVG